MPAMRERQRMRPTLARGDEGVAIVLALEGPGSEGW
jgi:hypothetical protein